MRNIYYLRFGSKIRWGFAAATPSLTPPLSLPLSGCRGKKMRGRGSSALLYRGGRLPPPAGRKLPTYHPASGRRVPAARQGGGRLPPLHKRAEVSLSPYFLSTTSREGDGERRGEGGSCSGEALPDFGSEPQVINISQLSYSKFFVCLIL